MLDINLFREEKGHNPELIRESQRRRFASVDQVDEVINLDKEWRKRTLSLSLSLSPLPQRALTLLFSFRSIRARESPQGVQQDQQGSLQTQACQYFPFLVF